MPRTVNMLLWLLYPAAWLAPLAEAGVVSWWSGDEITIYRGITDLWAVDPALSILVALFAIVIPYGKTMALSAVHFGMLGHERCPCSRPWESCRWPTFS